MRNRRRGDERARGLGSCGGCARQACRAAHWWGRGNVFGMAVGGLRGVMRMNPKKAVAPVESPQDPGDKVFPVLLVIVILIGAPLVQSVIGVGFKIGIGIGIASRKI